MRGLEAHSFVKLKTFSWSLLSVVLMGAGIGWVVYLLAATLDDPLRFVPDSKGWLLAATLLVALSLGMGIIIFGFFLNTHGGRRYPSMLITKLHVAGQLLRYLPGRLWGLAFQISSTHETIPAAILTRANIDFMVFLMIGNTSVALSLLSYRKPWPWWVAIIPVIGGVSVLCGVFLGGANRIMLKMSAFMPRKVRNTCELISVGQPTFFRLVGLMLIFLASWVAYMCGWSLLGCVFHSFAGVDFISLCAYYTLACIIGILSVLTPAGLGVREAVFVMLAAGSTDRETLAFFAVFGRIWLMVIEILMLAVVWFFLPGKKTECG